MAYSLKQLQKQNAKLRQAQAKINEMQRLNQERARLIQQNKQLQFRLKHKGLVKFADRASSFGSSAGKLALKGGTRAFQALDKWGQRLNEAERRERKINKRLSRKVHRTKKR